MIEPMSRLADLPSGAAVNTCGRSIVVMDFNHSVKSALDSHVATSLQQEGDLPLAPSTKGYSPGLLGAAMSLLKRDGNLAVRLSVNYAAGDTSGRGQEQPREGELNDEDSLARSDESSPYHHTLFTDPEFSDASSTAPLFLTIDTRTGREAPISESNCRSFRAKRDSSASKRQPLLPSDAKAINSGERSSKSSPTAASTKRSKRTKRSTYKVAAAMTVKDIKVGGKANRSCEDRKRFLSSSSPSSRLSRSTELIRSVPMTGITQRESGNYQARVYYERKGYYIGMFPTIEQASIAISVAKSELDNLKLAKRSPSYMFKRARTAALKAAAKLALAHAPPTREESREASTSAIVETDDDALDNKPHDAGVVSNPRLDKSAQIPLQDSSTSLDSNARSMSQRTEPVLLSAGKRKELIEVRIGCNDVTSQPRPAKRTATAQEQEDASAELLLLLATVADGGRVPTSTSATESFRKRKEDKIREQKASLETASSKVASSTSSTKESFGSAIPGNVHQKTVYLDPPALPTPKPSQFIEYASISPKRHVYVATDRDMPTMVKVNVLELCGAREVTHVIGTFPDVKQATCIFETVCNLIREDSGSLSPQDLAFALEMNDKGMPHMPPPLIRGHLGIAFIPQKLEWHLYCYFSGSKTPVVIGKYRIFVDAIFAYKTTSKLLHDVFYYYNHEMLRLRVRMDCLAHRAKTTPHYNHHTEIEMRHSLNNIRCMFAHALQEGTRPVV